jgi:CMP-N-acetylneuraminic acid synthetase
MNGAIYLLRASLLSAAEPSLYGARTAAYVMSAAFGISIDSLADWAAAERALEELVTKRG